MGNKLEDGRSCPPDSMLQQHIPIFILVSQYLSRRQYLFSRKFAGHAIVLPLHLANVQALTLVHSI